MNRTYSITRNAFAPASLTVCGGPAGPVADHYFDPPAAQRASEIVGTQLNEDAAGTVNSWRSPRHFISVAEDPEALMNDAGNLRPVHTKLVSSSFAVHPMFGPGHVLRTEGRIAAFWNGELCRVVHLTNLKFVQVTVSRTKSEPKVSNGPKALPAHVRAALDAD